MHSGERNKLVESLVMTGLKLASDNPFKDPLVNPLVLARALKKEGIEVLAWSPETLMAHLDSKYSDWSSERVTEALKFFHETGTIRSDIPQLVREKIYAIRTVATSNIAQTDWHAFEKVGGAFNDRTAKFGMSEPLSIGECARAVAIIEDIRPDTYENEIKIYVAASAHLAGLLTVGAVKWVAFAEDYLQSMNKDSTGVITDPETKAAITSKFSAIKLSKTLQEIPDDLVSVQAAKLVAIDHMGSEVAAHL